MAFPATSAPLAQALLEREYHEPTPVQTAVLEANASGRDLLVSAQTGSGKTVAFGLTIADTLLAGADRFTSFGDPVELIIAPTRELALQVQTELVWLYKHTGARVISCGILNRSSGFHSLPLAAQARRRPPSARTR